MSEDREDLYDQLASGIAEAIVQIKALVAECERLEAENMKLRAAFRVNALVWNPRLSHAEITAELERILKCGS